MADLITVQEISDYLRVTKKTIYRLLERNHIPSVKVGHQWRFDKVSIDKWLNKGSSLTNASILIIDDDEAICSLFKETLEFTGYTVTTVNDASQAIELVRMRDFDLIFLDLKLPNVNGAELFRQIREIKKDIPVTIITGYPDSDLMMSALEYGPLGVMKKPFTINDVLTAAKNYLRFK